MITGLASSGVAYRGMRSPSLAGREKSNSNQLYFAYRLASQKTAKGQRPRLADHCFLAPG